MSSHTSIFSRILSAIMLSPLEIGIALLGFAGWMAFYRFFWLWYRAPFKNLPGPKSNSWLFGSFKEIMVAGPGEVHAVWMQQYGHTIAYKGILGAPRIWTADPLALKTVLTRAYDFPKDDQTRDSLADVLGKGLLFAEGADHARQKRIMNPAFAPAQIRDNYTPIFWQKAYELRDCLSELVPDATNATRIDVYQWLGKATLDVIGLAGFGYDFDSLHDPDNELARAYGDMFKISFEITPWVVALALTPGGKYVPNARQRMVKICMETSQRIGRQLVEDKKRAVGDDKVAGRDLLSLIVRANMDPDLKETQRMTDEEMFGQITTFMLAGQETSSTALNWTLWKLSSHKDVQDQLRKECAGVQEEQPGMDAINELPFLDAVVRESLRLMAPVPVTRRDAAVDTELPLSIPVKGRDGKMMDKVPVPKGTAVLIRESSCAVESLTCG